MPRPIAILLALMTSAWAMGGTVTTREGKTLSGGIKLDAGAIIVTGADGKVNSVPLSQLAVADFANSTNAKAAAPTTQPAKWLAVDVGPCSTGGKLDAGAGDVITLVDSAKGLGARRRTSDSFFFVYQKLRGDVTITARLRVIEGNYSARAGVMIRSGLEPDCASAMTARARDGLTTILRRSASSLDCEETSKSERRIVGATWVRLERRGYTFTASESTDGKTWVALGTVEVPMEEEALVGLAASSCSITAARSVFDNIDVRTASGGKGETRTPKGIMTRNGSAVAGDVSNFDDGKVEFTGSDGVKKSLPASAIARCLFTPLLGSHEEKLKNMTSGVLLVGGDFLEGEIKSIDRGWIKISSVLFGAKTIDTRDAAAVLLRPITAEECPFEVRLKNQSLVRGKSMELSKDRVTIEEGELGKMTIEATELVEIRRPG